MDCILHVSAVNPISSKDVSSPMIGSLGCEAFILSLNESNSHPEGNVVEPPITKNHLSKIRSMFSGMLNDCAPIGHLQRLIIPKVASSHFFVVCFDFSVTVSQNEPYFFKHILVYDSLVKNVVAFAPTASKDVMSLVKEVNIFFNTFILHGDNYTHLQECNDHLLQRVKFHQCPIQNNGYDCGIFAVACALHLSEHVPVTATTFSDADVRRARSILALAFSTKDACIKSTREEVRQCFPMLRHDSVDVPVDSDVEMMIPLTSLFLTTRSTRRNPISLDCNFNAFNAGSRQKPITFSTPPQGLICNRDGNDTTESDSSIQAASRSVMVNLQNSEAIITNDASSPTLTTVNAEETSIIDTSSIIDTVVNNTICNVDNLMLLIMEEQQVHSFKALTDVDNIVHAYEQRSGNRLRIYKSERNKHRCYECRSHVGCTFKIRFAWRPNDSFYCLVTKSLTHLTLQRPEKAKDGRKFKKRRLGTMDDYLEQVVQTKHGVPLPADVIKTAANKDNVVLGYMPPWRMIKNGGYDDIRSGVKNFELIVPYLQEMKKCNPSSVIGYSRVNDTCEILDIHFFPGFVNEVLKFVRPVISVDAAHLKSQYTGTLYIASVKSGHDDVYPLGFMISYANEDLRNWTKMLRLLKEAYPIISEPQREFPFVFVSDRCKGLKQALSTVFPNNCETSCAYHIRSNVEQKFGNVAASDVMAMALTYSKRYYNYLLEKMRRTKHQAAEYIERINESGVVWSNSQSTDNIQQLPPRFGQVTSNTAESVNSMFESARDLVWLDAVERMIEIMLTRICNCHEKYKHA